MLFLLAIALHASWASAANSRVAVEAPETPLTKQLRVELAALGFEVVDLEHLSELDLGTNILKLAREDDITAVIRTAQDGRRLEVWVADVEINAFVTRGVDASQGSPRILAIRAIELLRAGLREIETRRQLARTPPPPERKSAPPPLPPDILPPVPAPTLLPKVELCLGAGVVASPGGVDKNFALVPAVRVWPFDDWGVSIFALVSLEAPRVVTRDGSASVTVFLGGIGPAFRLRPPHTKFQFDASLGGGASLLRVNGSPAPSAPVEGQTSLVGQTDYATSPMLYASAALRYDFVPEVGVGATVLGGALVPRAQIRFANHTVANWGGLYGVGMLGLTVKIR